MMRAAGERLTAASGLAAVVAVIALVAGVVAGAVWLGMDLAASASFFKTEAAEARYKRAYDAVLAKWPVAYGEITVPTRLVPRTSSPAARRTRRRWSCCTRRWPPRRSGGRTSRR